jgi:hypothetical protein
MKRTMMIAMVSACVLALGACGDDGGDGNTTGGTGGATGGSSGSAGDSGEGGSDSGGTGGTTGGTGGGDTGGTGGTTGGTGGTMAVPVMCGGMECPTPMNTRLRACCVDDGDVCGEEIPGGFIGTCAAPVESHPECDEGSIAGLGGMAMMVPSCCTPEGQCGLTAPILEFDCTSNEEIMGLLDDAGVSDGGTSDAGSSRPRPMVTAPAPSTCTP